MIEQAVLLRSEGRWPSDLAIWHVAIPASEQAIDVAVLDASEHARAALYRQDSDRRRFQATRSALRNVLGRHLDIDPSSVRFKTGSRGRPALRDTESALSFNVSHAGDHALIALSDTRDVGIDVERIDPTLDWRTLLDLVCTPSERLLLSDTTLSPALLRQRFFQCWTAKEALLKARGLGIADGLQSLSIDFSAGVRPLAATLGPSMAGMNDLRYCWLLDIPGYMGCLAFASPATVASERIACDGA
ncbi:4'-phosphopantetheinyl transferase superfamily protein [Robbsia sp. KACC 23696]|uniref:4'-phosphopantetheinyl transferase family protein n=1 Tax=Robbsia sp. KACC 23696 TaxID=3149231 RepID=UPI00325AC8AE